VQLTLKYAANPPNMTNTTAPDHSSLAPEAARGGAPDNLTIIAIAIVVTVIADVLHEGAGLGGACLLTGGHPLGLSTVHFECDSEGRLVAAGGTVVNLIAGLLPRPTVALNAGDAAADLARNENWERRAEASVRRVESSRTARPLVDSPPNLPAVANSLPPPSLLSDIHGRCSG
jgi:hypothetical protein